MGRHHSEVPLGQLRKPYLPASSRPHHLICPHEQNLDLQELAINPETQTWPILFHPARTLPDDCPDRLKQDEMKGATFLHSSARL